MKPNFSIIILTETMNLKTCIDNINKFTTSPYEIIVVYTGPNDINIDHSQYKYISCHDMNISLAYNNGLEIAKGDLLVMLSPNVTVSANWDRELLTCAQLSENIGLIGRTKRKTKTSTMEELGSHIVDVLDEDCLLIKRKVIDHIGDFDERFSSKHFMFSDFFLRTRLAGFELLHCNENYIEKNYDMQMLDNIDYLNIYQNDRKKFVEKWREFLPIKNDLITEILNKLPVEAMGDILFLGDNPIIPNTLMNRGYSVVSITCSDGYNILWNKKETYDIIILFDNITHECNLIKLLKDGKKILNHRGLIIANIYNSLYIERIHHVFRGNFSIAAFDTNKKYPIQCLSRPEIMASSEVAEMELMYLVGFASDPPIQFQKLFKEICKTNPSSKFLREEICIEEYLAVWQKNR